MSTIDLAPPPQSLSAEQLASYHRDGYIVIRGVFSPEEVAVWKAESERLLASDMVAPNNLRTAPRKMPDGRLQCERFDPVVDVSPVFNALVADERVLGPVQDIFADKALLFKDKLIFKVPGMSGYTMHQDFAHWQPSPENPILAHIDANDILSVTIAIDGAEAENGALELFSGYHHDLLIPPGQLRNMRDEEVAELIDESRGQLIATQPGDIVIFHSLTPHRSGNNTSQRSRRQLYMTYNAARSGDHYATQQQHYRGYTTRNRNNEGITEVYFR